jgi:hypothetical protein
MSIFKYPLITLISIQLLNSCASGLQRPESIAEKMKRYKSKIGQVNAVPEIPLVQEQWVQSSRAPASIGPLASSQKVNYSNKKMYFFTLWLQYKTLKKFTKQDNAPQINSCPKFHTSMVGEQWESQMKAGDFNKIKWKNLQQQDISYFPEVHLPTTRNHTLPTVKDSFKDVKFNDEYQKTVDTAFENHLAKMFVELKELCEHGSSYNYYAFENLLTHTKQHTLMANNENMDRLLKTSIFSNHLIIESLRKKNSQDKYDMMIREINNRIGGQWVNAYFDYYREKRIETIGKFK